MIGKIGIKHVLSYNIHLVWMFDNSKNIKTRLICQKMAIGPTFVTVYLVID